MYVCTLVYAYSIIPCRNYDSIIALLYSYGTVLYIITFNYDSTSTSTIIYITRTIALLERLLLPGTLCTVPGTTQNFKILCTGSASASARTKLVTPKILIQ